MSNCALRPIGGSHAKKLPFYWVNTTYKAVLLLVYSKGYQMNRWATLQIAVLQQEGEELFGIGENLNKVVRIIPPTELPDLEIKVLCDVQNPFYGKDGAAYIYGPQKGAGIEEVKLLDEGLKNLAKRFHKDLGIDISSLSGAGAAGGIAGGAVAGFSGKLLSGIEALMNLVDFKNKVQENDLVITGEGKLDQQTLNGKLIKGIADVSRAYGKKCVAFCGVSELNEGEVKELGLVQVFSLLRPEITAEDSIKNAGKHLRTVAKDFVDSL